MQTYKVKRHSGKRLRPVVTVTLAQEEVAMLERLAEAQGMTKSGFMGQLIRRAAARGVKS